MKKPLSTMKLDNLRIKIVAYAFIAYPVARLIAAYIISSKYEIFSLMRMSPAKSIFAFLPCLVVSCIIVIGLWKTKKWARLFAISATIYHLICLISYVWFFGIQILSSSVLAWFLQISLILHGLVLYILFQPDTKKLFTQDTFGFNLSGKILLGFYCLTFFIPIGMFLVAYVGSLVVFTEVGSLSSDARVKPPVREIVEDASDSIELFGYQIHVPLDYEIYSFHVPIQYKERAPGDFVVSLQETKSEKEGLTSVHMDDFSLLTLFYGGKDRKVLDLLGLSTPYELQRRIAYSSPFEAPFFYIIGTIIRGPGESSIEEIDADTWRGFIVERKWRAEVPTTAFWVNSLDDERSFSIVINTKDEGLVDKMLHSISIRKTSLRAEHYYKEGRNYLKKKQFTQAGISFLAAIYQNDAQKEYYYWLSKSILEGKDPREINNRMKLYEINVCLGKAVNLDSQYQDAIHLMKDVEAKMKSIPTSSYGLSTAQILKRQTSPEILKRKRIQKPSYEIYIPSNLDLTKKHPLVFGLSPSANGQSMVNLWKKACDKHGWIVVGSNDHRNGVPFQKLFGILYKNLEEVIKKYPIDEEHIIFSGMSGGGMGSHAFSYNYPDVVWGIVVNTGMMNEVYLNEHENYPNGKFAVFLASPTDFRYDEMQRDKKMLDGLEWKTKWIEFKGGHKPAPLAYYMQAADWLQRQIEQEKVLYTLSKK